MILTKRVYNKINYKVILTLKFRINVLTLSKNYVHYMTEDNDADNRVEDNTSYNRTVEAK